MTEIVGTQNYTIYKITNSVNEMIYIGSTNQTLRRRWTSHKTPKQPMAQFISETGTDNFTISPIVELVCTKKEARLLEQSEIDRLSPDVRLNKQRAFATKEQRRLESNKTKSMYYYRNKQIIFERRKVYKKEYSARKKAEKEAAKLLEPQVR